MFPLADGTAKLSGRDHEFRESTLRRDQPVGSEDPKEELQGSSERSQPTETKDGAEAYNDFWSVEGDFTYRDHIELRVQLQVSKEETFPIPLKYIDVTRTCGRQSKFIRFSERFTKFTVLKEKPPKGYMWSRGDKQRFKQLPDLIICGWEKPHRRKRSKNGQTRNQSSIMLKIERHLFHRSGRW